MGGDLLLRVGEGVEGMVDLFPNYLVLYAHDCLEEDVVLRLGFDADVKLLNTYDVASCDKYYFELELLYEQMKIDK